MLLHPAISYQLSALSRAPYALPSAERLGKLGALGGRVDGTIAATELTADR